MKKLAWTFRVVTVVNYMQRVRRIFRMVHLFRAVTNSSYKILMLTEWIERHTHALSLGTDGCPPTVACSTENRTVFLSTRPEDILDPGDRAARVPLAGSGASGGSG